MRTKFDAVFLHLANFCEAENLKTAAVSENRQIPIHEFVQSARGADDVESGTQVEMISVAENDLRAHLVEFTRVERLDAGLRADGHEHGRLDDAVRSGQPAKPRFRVRIGFEQFKHRAKGKLNTARLKMKFSRAAKKVRLNLRLAGDFAPVNSLRSSVDGEGFFVLNQHGAHDAGIIRTAKFQNAFRDDAGFFVCIDEREDRLRDGDKRQFLVSAFDHVLDGVGEKFELVHEVRKFRRVNLGEPQFPLRQLAQDFQRDGGRNVGGTVIYEFGDFGHDGNLVKAAPA